MFQSKFEIIPLKLATGSFSPASRKGCFHLSATRYGPCGALVGRYTKNGLLPPASAATEVINDMASSNQTSVQ